jgi:hypothetical protein
MKNLLLILIILLTGCSWSKSDIAWGVASTLATGADFYTTSEFLENPSNYEMNPILGKHPSNSEVFMVLATSQIIVLTIAHFYPKLRPYLLSAKTAWNGGLAIHNSKLPR